MLCSDLGEAFASITLCIAMTISLMKMFQKETAMSRIFVSDASKKRKNGTISDTSATPPVLAEKGMIAMNYGFEIRIRIAQLVGALCSRNSVG